MFEGTMSPGYLLAMTWDLYPWLLVAMILVTIAAVILFPWKTKVIVFFLWVLIYLIFGILLPMKAIVFYVLIAVAFIFGAIFMLGGISGREDVRMNAINRETSSSKVPEKTMADYPVDPPSAINWRGAKFSAPGTTMTLEGIFGTPDPNYAQAYKEARASGSTHNVQNIIDNKEYFNQGCIGECGDD